MTSEGHAVEATLPRAAGRKKTRWEAGFSAAADAAEEGDLLNVQVVSDCT